MTQAKVLADALQERGVSRRAFLKYASFVTSLMALPPSMAPAMAEGLAKALPRLLDAGSVFATLTAALS